jgi:hypothetical protein
MDDYRPEVKAMLDKMLLHIPGVKSGKAFGYPAYKINAKVFAFVGGNGIAIKLGKARVDELIAQSESMRPFEVADGVIWKDWVSIEMDDPDLYRRYASLLDESIHFVAGSVS